MRYIVALLAATLAAFSFDAQAQNSFPTPGGSSVIGAVTMCNNGSGFYIPCAPGGGGGGTVNTIPQCNGTPCSQANPFFTVFAAGEFHVGEFGSNQIATALALANTGTAYATGVAIGNQQTLANAVRVNAAPGQPGTSGNVLGTVITSSLANTVPIDVYYFSASPTASTCTDTTAFALVAADAAKVLGIAHVTDWTAGNPSAVGQAFGPPIPYTLNVASSLFICVVSRGAFVPAASGVNLQVRLLRQ